MLILFYLALCACVGLFAHHHRNRNSLGWGALSIVITPLIGGLVVAILPPLDISKRSGLRAEVLDSASAYWAHLAQPNARPVLHPPASREARTRETILVVVGVVVALLIAIAMTG